MELRRLFTLIHVSDLHFGHPDPISAEVKEWWCKFPMLSGYFGHEARALAYLQEAVAGLRETEPDARLVVTGDLTAYASDRQFDLALSYIHRDVQLAPYRKYGLKFGSLAVVVPGNHDHWVGRPAERINDFVMYGGPTEFFKNAFALPDILLTESIGDRRIVIVGIDTDAGLKERSPSKFFARGSFVKQLDQAEDLFIGAPQDELRVLMLHHSRMHHNFVCGIKKGSQLALDEFIRRNHISVLLSGHVHVSNWQYETVKEDQEKWILLEGRCGTTSQRSLKPLGCPSLELEPNSFLVHRLFEDNNRALYWNTEEFVRSPRTPFSSDGLRRNQICLMR